jgi:hypothetical protein
MTDGLEARISQGGSNVERTTSVASRARARPGIYLFDDSFSLDLATGAASAPGTGGRRRGRRDRGAAGVDVINADQILVVEDGHQSASARITSSSSSDLRRDRGVTTHR